MVEYTAKYIGNDDPHYPFLKNDEIYRIVLQSRNETGTDTSFVYVWTGRMYNKIIYQSKDYISTHWRLLD